MDHTKIIAAIRAADPETLTRTQAQDFARETYNNYDGWVYAWYWRDIDPLSKYQREAERAAHMMREELAALKSRLEATAMLADLLTAAIAAQGGKDV